MKLSEIEKRLAFFMQFSKKSMKGLDINEWIKFHEELGTYLAEASEIVIITRENYNNAKHEQKSDKDTLYTLKQQFERAKDITALMNTRKNSITTIISAEKEMIKSRL